MSQLQRQQQANWEKWGKPTCAVCREPCKSHKDHAAWQRNRLCLECENALVRSYDSKQYQAPPPGISHECHDDDPDDHVITLRL